MLRVLLPHLQLKLRNLIELIGERAFAWGVLTAMTGLVAFGFDLAFAISLQRFLISIDLISSGGQPSIFGPIGRPALEMTLFLAAGSMRVIIMWINGFATGICQVTFETERRHDIARWALHSGRASISEVTSLFNDVVIGASAVVSSSFYVASRVILIALSLFTLVWYSLYVTLAVMALVALATPLHRIIDRRLNLISAAMQAALSNVISLLVGNVKNSMFLHIHGLVPAEIDRARSLLKIYERSQRRYYWLASSRGAAPQLTGLLAVSGIAFYGAFVFGDERGAIVAYLYLTLRLFQGLSELARVTANIRANKARLTVLQNWWVTSYLPQRERIVGETRRRDYQVERLSAVGWHIEHLSFGWGSNRPLMRDFSLGIPAGSTTVVIGPSGGGKTTFLLLLTGLLDATSGTVMVRTPEGVQPVIDARERLLASTAFVGPDPFVVPGSIRELLAFGSASVPSDGDIAEALRLAHCDFVFNLSAGLDHVVTEQGGGLSAGQKQRLSLARALLRKPSVLLLDEATANLDDDTETAIVATLKELKGKVTIIAVTHRSAMRTIADQIIEFGADGTPVSVGPTASDCRRERPDSHS